jgi:hypothetical protein
MAYPGMPSVPGYAQPLSFGERAADMLSGTAQLGTAYTMKNMFAQPNYQNEYYKQLLGLG